MLDSCSMEDAEVLDSLLPEDTRVMDILSESERMGHMELIVCHLVSLMRMVRAVDVQ